MADAFAKECRSPLSISGKRTCNVSYLEMTTAAPAEEDPTCLAVAHVQLSVRREGSEHGFREDS